MPYKRERYVSQKHKFFKRRRIVREQQQNVEPRNATEQSTSETLTNESNEFSTDSNCDTLWSLDEEDHVDGQITWESMGNQNVESGYVQSISKNEASASDVASTNSDSLSNQSYCDDSCSLEDGNESDTDMESISEIFSHANNFGTNSWDATEYSTLFYALANSGISQRSYNKIISIIKV